jgi:hypothetical protein
MSQGILNRLDRISAAVLPGKTHALDVGENYYSFEMTDELGTRPLLAHVWIDPDTSDRDASVPNIQTEGSNHR